MRRRAFITLLGGSASARTRDGPRAYLGFDLRAGGPPDVWIVSAKRLLMAEVTCPVWPKCKCCLVVLTTAIE
jgi:hypothetical protein